MSATTIKLEGEILREIRAMKESDQSISAYVREVLKHEISQRRMAEAARKYQMFLAEDVDESLSMKEWETASLDQPLRPKH